LRNKKSRSVAEAVFLFVGNEEMRSCGLLGVSWPDQLVPHDLCHLRFRVHSFPTVIGEVRMLSHRRRHVL